MLKLTSIVFSGLLLSAAAGAVQIDCQTVGAFRREYHKTLRFHAEAVADAVPTQFEAHQRISGRLQCANPQPAPAGFDSNDPEAADYLRYDVTGPPADEGDLYYLLVPKGTYAAVGHFMGYLDVLFAGGAHGWWRMPLKCSRTAL